MKRPVFSFRPNLDNPEHRRAWEILQAVPDGQKNQYLVQVILKVQEGEYLEKLIQKTVREELKGDGTAHPASVTADTIPSQMLDFLSQMDGDM